MAPPSECDSPQRLSLRLRGLVQGVGLRPFLHRLAAQLALDGWVRNGRRGVELELEGPRAALHQLLHTLQAAPPPHCRIDQLEASWGPAGGTLGSFRILAPEPDPEGSGVADAWISPDIAICADCLAELSDASNRRHGYPFISCTNCGPRYTLLRRLPFERHHTSLAAFPLCPDCHGEYSDPANRRFHAQTISCPACGPQLQWQLTGQSPAKALANAAAIRAAAATLRSGGIVAAQGIGGFQLLVDPTNAAAVAELRRRKGRPDKPLALLARPDWLERCCHLSPAEWQQWWSPAAPIVLLRPRDEAAELAEEVSRGSAWLGVMRAASGLHHLLLEAFGPVLVATSANRSSEPMAIDAAADAAMLAALADGVLSHGLPIVNRIDDSVLRLAAGEPLVLRLGRGLAPLALPHATDSTPKLALGAQLKGSVAVQLPQTILLSPDLGDLSSSRGAEHLQRTALHWLERHQLQPALIACDQHPSYSSSQLAADLAQQMDRPLQTVQHHHAHLLAVLAEHGLREESLGVAWDGAGQGDDNSLWGGEAFAVGEAGYRRLARLRPFRLPGGEVALREPRRAALGLLIAAWGESWREHALAWGPLPCLESFEADALLLLAQASQRGFQAPLCSSVGRLFDAVAALLGLHQICSYEAQAAMALEGLAAAALHDPRRAAQLHRYAIPLRTDAALAYWDWQPLLEAVLRDRSDPSIEPAAIALAVHQALAQAIVDLTIVWPEPCRSTGLLLAGGCFQNAVLLDLCVTQLREQGIKPYWPQRLPCNDAALAAGQLLAAPTLPINSAAPWAAHHVPRRTG